MPIGRSDFQIGIKTTADTAAIDQTKQGLDDIGREAEKAGDKSEEASDKQSEGAHKVELSHRELRESVHAVAAQFGGLADVGLWLNPMTAALAAVLAGIEAIKKTFEGFQDTINQFNEGMAAIDSAKFDALAKSASDARAAIGEIVDKAEEMQSAFDRSNASLDAGLKKFNEQHDAVIKIAEAQEKAYEAELDYQSQINPALKVQNEIRKEDARLQLDRMRATNQETELQHQISTLADQQDKAKKRLSSGKDMAALAAAEAAAAGPAAAAGAAAAAVENAKKASIEVQGGDQFGLFNKNATFENAEALAKAIQKTKDQMQDYSEHWDKYQAIQHPEGQQGALASLQKQLDALQEASRSHESNVSNLQRLADLADVEKKRAEQKIADAQKQIEIDQQLRIEGGVRIQSLQDELNILRQTNAAVAEANARAAAANAASASHVDVGRAFSEASALEHTLANRGGTGRDWQQMARLLQTLHDAVRGGVQIDSTLAANIHALETEVAALRQQVGDHETRAQHSAYPW